MDTKEIMRIADVAEYLQLKPQTIYTWAQKGKIPGVKLGKEWRFKKSIIDKWFILQFTPQFKEFIPDVQDEANPSYTVHKQSEFLSNLA